MGVWHLCTHCRDRNTNACKVVQGQHKDWDQERCFSCVYVYVCVYSSLSVFVGMMRTLLESEDIFAGPHFLTSFSLGIKVLGLCQ